VYRPANRLLTLATAVFALGLGGFALAAPNEPVTKPPKAQHAQHDPAARAQRLREKLSLTSAQEPALQTFLATKKPAAGATGAKPDKDAWKAQQQQAAATFRGQLTSDQQTRFDEMMRNRQAHHQAKAKAEPLH
jgi:hypothetical protein